ncbi:hypothetical protein [Yinghuangia seranimata]|uniref:hypothetical protein n=1 Tax=Yinghuangia seranimata TaxID=408067 RepID=UPI00248B469B|nr:hypothetical protein [Yinghuangia seranimata]MDI2130327.1 hypothetical protein [Yinghuangia seranimata]
MTDPLVGLWRGVPFDASATRRIELAFLGNGMGWTEWTTAVGGVEVVGFRWRATGPTVLEVLDIWCAFGLTAERSAVEWDELEWRDDPPFTVEFVLGPEPGARPGAAPGEAPARSLRVSGTLGGAREFTAVRPDVTFADCPAREVAPELGVGIADAVSRLPGGDLRGDPKTRP